MANRKINGTYGVYYRFEHDGDSGPEVVLYLKSARTSPVYSDEGDSAITIPGAHLAAFCTELIHMARELGVTEEAVKC